MGGRRTDVSVASVDGSALDKKWLCVKVFVANRKDLKGFSTWI